jgi:hypothetical protein
VFLEVIIMKVRILPILAALLLLFVMAGGCSTSGSTSLNAVLKILPDSASNVFVADWGKLSTDTNLQELWTTYSGKINTASMEEYLGVNSEDVELMAMAAGGTAYYIVLKGKLDMEKIRTVMKGQKLERQDDYLRVEVWTGDASIAFIHDMMVVAMSVDSLKTMIRLHEGEEKTSLYNDKDYNSIINKLPAGIFTILSTGGGYNAISTGMSFGAASADTLRVSQYYLYADTAAAVAGKADIDSTGAANSMGTIDSVTQKNSLVEVQGNMSIEDFMNSPYFTNMGF